MQLKGRNSKIAIIVMTKNQAKIQETFSKKKTEQRRVKSNNMYYGNLNTAWFTYFDLVLNYIYIFIIKVFLKNFQTYLLNYFL